MTEIAHGPRTAAVPGLGVTALLLGAVVLGAVLGLSDPALGASLSQGIDPTLAVMLALLFFEVRLRAVAVGVANLRFIALAWIANFLIVPVIGFTIASLFLTGHPLLYVGLLIYFLAPCTDWFLAFTRMARGDTALGAVLVPINLLTQFLLFPVWLWLFTRQAGVVDFGIVPDLMLHWFLLPFGAAQVARWLLARMLSAVAFDRVCEGFGLLIPVVTAALVFQILAANLVSITAHLNVFGLILLAILVFFVVTFGVADGLSRLFGLRYREQALLTMTTAARNAPLMLALTAIAIPDQPLVYAALVIGMLVEFPHLTVVKQLLLTKAIRGTTAWPSGRGLRD
ncbi:MAG: arsenic resistance protein, partial [Pseudomonadota bacterium]